MFKKRKGWMSIELIHTLIIMLALMAVIVPKGNEMLNVGRDAQARSVTAALGAAISEYYFEIGEYPESLDALTIRKGQYGPWVTSSTYGKDPWNHPYVYLKNSNGFAVFSIGSNNQNDGSTVEKIADGDIGFTGR